MLIIFSVIICLLNCFYTTESRIQEKEMAQHINTAIDTLPSKCREVFVMSRYDHLKYSEIALKLNISQKTVERHMGMALEKLRRLLKNVHLRALKTLLNFIRFGLAFKQFFKVN